MRRVLLARLGFAGALAALALLLACDGCEQRAPRRTPADSESSRGNGASQENARDAHNLWVDQAVESRLFALAGKVDIANRYTAAVLVLGNFSQDREQLCSGALISRHLVLTAGHCVCAPSSPPPGGGESSIDGSTCMKIATVETTVYQAGEDLVDNAPAHMRRYRGRVRPHPSLRVLMNEQGQVVSSVADLALILLDAPVEEGIQPFGFSASDLQVNESIIVVGSGYDEMTQLYDGKRRYSRNTITERMPSGGGRMLIAQPQGHHYQGDSGGPCLREEHGRSVLTGISNRNGVAGASVTSIHEYLDWLGAEIERAEAMKTLERPQ